MFGSGKGFFGGLIGLFFFSIVVFFVIYLLVPDVSIRFFGISVNSDEYIAQAVSQSVSELDMPEGVMSDIQSYLSSPEGKAYLDEAEAAVGNGADKVLAFFSSDGWRNTLERAGNAIASGVSSASDFFAAHPVTTGESK